MVLVGLWAEFAGMRKGERLPGQKQGRPEP